MFRNLRINIFIYYIVTSVAFLGIFYYFLEVVATQNTFLLSLVMLCFVALSGVFISKLSIDPLQEHVQNLQNLSKETLHELNLPISTIMTNVHMLKKKMSDEKDLKRMLRIELACSMLQERYNELDYMIKTQAQKTIQERFELSALVQKRVEFLGSAYPLVSFNLMLETTTIIGDSIGLSKVVDNIIDNGVKYSPNSPKIEIKLVNFELHIQDYGCGMDEVELLQIFDNYYQSNTNMQGFGIGLGMVKRFCDRHDIGLNFKSKKDTGTTVILKFKEN